MVRRDGDRVVCVPVVPDAPEVGEQEKFVIGEHRSLTMRLVREALIGEVAAMRYKVSAFARPAFVSRYPQHVLLAQAAGDQRGALAALHVYPEYKLDTRVSGPASQPGVIVGLRTRCEIDLTNAELMELGIDAGGRYVLAETGEVPFNPDLDEHVYWRLAGAVESVRDGRLYLSDAPMLTDVEAGKAWLEGRRENLQDVMAALTGGRHARVLEMLEEAKFGLLGAEGRLNRITALARRLAAAGPLKIANGVCAEIGLPAGSEAGDGGGGGLESAKFYEPTFVFDPGGDKTDKSAAKGLAGFGPFDSQFFTPRRPRITVLTPRAFQGTVEVFMDRFRRGVPDSKAYAQGFARKYRLADCDVIVEEIGHVLCGELLLRDDPVSVASAEVLDEQPGHSLKEKLHGALVRGGCERLLIGGSFLAGYHLRRHEGARRRTAAGTGADPCFWSEIERCHRRQASCRVGHPPASAGSSSGGRREAAQLAARRRRRDRLALSQEHRDLAGQGRQVVPRCLACMLRSGTCPDWI